jgi:putative transport protein
MPAFIIENSLLVFFCIILLGTYLGKISVKNISLGSSAVFLTALVFGHFGFTMPIQVRDIGLVLFVYAISIQVGPYFFKVFRKDGWKFALAAFVSIFAGIIATILLAIFFHIPDNLAIGMYSGAVTNTPSLAVAVDMLEKNNAGDGAIATAGYGIAYPFSVLATVLFVQFLPKLLRRKPEEEEEEWEEKEKASRHELSVKQFLLENKTLFGKTVADIHAHKIASINLSRVRRGGKERVAIPEFVLEEGDIITAVGEDEDLNKLAIIIGTETKAPLLHNKVVSEDVEVASSEFVNKKMWDLPFYEHNIVVTRIIRQDFEMAPNGGTVLEAGDILRLVGDHAEMEKMIKRIGVKNEKLNETNMLPFFLGIVLGIFIGAIPIPTFAGARIALGSPGGALLAGLFISHRKRIGKMEMHVPIAALNLIREIGLTFFFAGAGLIAGSRFVEVFQQYGFSILIAGAFITFSSLIAGTIFLVLFKENILSIMGGVSAAMTQPAGLAVAKNRAKTELPTLVYASVYPFATIGKVVFIQFLVYALWIL